ncbi:MAG: Nif3-like dinuclear metal center hexameric protein, partial [Christensenellales bacterium]
MAVRCRDILAILEELAPFSLAEPWDNVGFLLGDRNGEVGRILVTLDVTEAVVQEAIEKQCELIVSHHPLFFKGVKSLNEDTFEGRLAAALIRAGIGVCACHTNFDKAQGGTCDALADIARLGLRRPLLPDASTDRKLVVFVPSGYEEQVASSLFEAGAGVIGDYQGCSFSVAGTGSFVPGQGSSPFIGAVGQREQVEETRLEVLVPLGKTEGVLEALYGSHPYEEPAFDLYTLSAPARTGLGRVGELDKPCLFHEFCRYVSRGLDVGVKVMGNGDTLVRRVAVQAGTGGREDIQAAVRVGADVLFCGEVKYHDCLYAAEEGLCLVDAGHYGSE